MTWKRRMIGASSVIFAAAFGLSSSESGAQGRASLESVTLSPSAAKRALTRTEINADTAEKLVNACLEYSKAHNGGASVVVISASGYLVHAHRTDGQQPNNIDSALHKAQTALYLRASTREGLNRWNNLEAQIVRADMNLYLNPGGFPIIVDDQLIGAIGVGGASGGDDQCGYEALTKVLATAAAPLACLIWRRRRNEPPVGFTQPPARGETSMTTAYAAFHTLTSGLLAVAVGVAAVGSSAAARSRPADHPSVTVNGQPTPRSILARNMGTDADQTTQFPPHKIIGNIYYVGTRTLSSFLIVTPQGNILIDSTYERNVPVIQKSVEQLGFKLSDIKILLGNHAHGDHMEGDAVVKQLTGAQVMAMAEDVPALQAPARQGTSGSIASSTTATR